MATDAGPMALRGADGAVAAAKDTALATTACLNCGAAVPLAFCPRCGQKAHVHRSLLHMGEEFLHSLVHFDGKLWRTLPMLVFRPGTLTRDYIQGRRARYVAPVALFLMTIFLMFLLFGLLPAPDVQETIVPRDPAAAAARLPEAEQALADIGRQIADARADPARQGELPALELGKASATALRDSLRAAAAGQPVAEPGWSAAIRAARAQGQIGISTGNSGLDRKALDALEDPQFVFYKMKQKGYKLSFLLVPLSLPWMLLLFAWKKDVRAYDHVVFLLYSISFMTALFMLAALLGTAGVESAAPYLTLFLAAPLVHLFFQLKGGYRLGWAAAAWRAAALATLAMITLLLYFSGILFLGLVD
jgi:hypothetical protein